MRRYFFFVFAALLVILPLAFNLAIAQEETILIVEESSGSPGSSNQVTISMNNAANVGALDLALRYDPDVIQFSEGRTGEIAGDAMIELNEIEPGLLLAALADVNGLSGDGVVIEAGFNVVGQTGDRTPIVVERAEAYHYELLTDIPLKTTDGAFSVQEGSQDLNGTIDDMSSMLPLTAIIACTICATAIVGLILLVLVVRRNRQGANS